MTIDPNDLVKAELRQKTIEFIYKNHRGEVALRRTRPYAIIFQATKYHPEPQWIIRAYDFDREEIRDFALKDCNFLQTTSQQSGGSGT